MWLNQCIVCQTSNLIEFPFFGSSTKYQIYKQKEIYCFVCFQTEEKGEEEEEEGNYLVCGTFVLKFIYVLFKYEKNIATYHVYCQYSLPSIVADDHFKSQSTFLHFIKIESGFFLSFDLMMHVAEAAAVAVVLKSSFWFFFCTIKSPTYNWFFYLQFNRLSTILAWITPSMFFCRTKKRAICLANIFVDWVFFFEQKEKKCS